MAICVPTVMVSDLICMLIIFLLSIILLVTFKLCNMKYSPHSPFYASDYSFPYTFDQRSESARRLVTPTLRLHGL